MAATPLESLAESGRLIEPLACAVAVIDSNGVVVLVNAEAERLFARTRDEMLNRAFGMLVVESESQQPLDSSHLLRTTVSTAHDLVGIRRDGRRFPIRINFRILDFDDGCFVVATMEDVSHHRDIEQQLRTAFEALDSAAAGIIITDRQNAVRYANPAFLRMFQYDEESQIIGKSAVELFSAKQIQEFADVEQMIDGEAGATKEFMVVRSDGTRFPVEVASSSVTAELGRPVSRMASFVDITARKQAEVSQRTYRAELERSNRELDDFAYVASHDLRAPLRGIANLANWVLEDAGDVLPDKSRAHLKKMQQRVKRMESLLDDLLNFSRVGRVQWTSQQVDTGELVRNIAELQAPEEFAVTVAKDLPTLTTSRVLLEEVFRNLIGNAIKHHDRPNGRIEVTARSEGAYVEFTVSDDGPGIAPEFHERIFLMFQTLKPRDEVEGSGMGLALVRKIVEGQGGVVCVESAVKHGATFRFTWPKA